MNDLNINLKTTDIDTKKLKNSFPPDFVWGVATSSYQIEGAAQVGGRGPSIWDDFCKLPGTIADASDGSIACDHYHKLNEDLDLIASLGVDAYRFSVSWSRVQPSGKGVWNEEGLAFYERLVDGLIARGIKPYLTLNHWDLPSALQASGGWFNRDTVQCFVDYALGIHNRFGNKICAYTTHNEPWVIAVLGHETGVFAPGIQSRAVAAQVSHHLMLSHGMALEALRAAGCKAKLGIVLNLSPVYPVSNLVKDIEKAKLEDGKLLRWYMDPLFKGQYPADVIEHLGADAPNIKAGDMEIIKAPMDYLGINYYTRAMVSAEKPWDVHAGGCDLTDMEWEICPEGLVDLLLRLNRDYPLPPIYVTENGGAFKDLLDDGAVHDEQRTQYLVSHIQAVASAMEQGVRMGGYMVWSLLDNFEWASGYEKRFGITYVDYQTLNRTLKDSGIWYRDFLTARHNLNINQARKALTT